MKRYRLSPHWTLRHPLQRTIPFVNPMEVNFACGYFAIDEFRLNLLDGDNLLCNVSECTSRITYT